MATTNLGKVSVTPKGEYDPLITYERLDIVNHNGSSYIVKQASTGVTPIEGEFYALIAEKGDGGSFLEKSYKTYAAMELDKPNLTANISTRVSNDSDTAKNGSYTYDGTVFTRSQYDSKVVTDKVIADTAIAVQDAINNTVISSGFVTIDSFEIGATITQRNQALRHAADGKLYRWAGELPKVVPANSTPISSGGIGANAWLEVNDVALRQDIIAGNLITDAIVKTAPSLPNEVARNLADKNRDIRSLLDFHEAERGDIYTQTLVDAIESGYAIYVPDGTYKIECAGIKILQPNVKLYSNGNATFELLSGEAISPVILTSQDTVDISGITINRGTSDSSINIGWRRFLSMAPDAVIGSIKVDKCKTKNFACLMYMDGSPTLNPESQFYGIKDVEITNSDFLNSYHIPVHFNNCPVVRLLVEKNNFRNSLVSCIYQGIQNEHPYALELQRASKLSVVRANTFTNDDDVFARSGGYHCAFLSESNKTIWQDNHVEGFKSTFADGVVYDAYISSLDVVHTGNTFVNNAALHPDAGYRVLIKAKGNSTDVNNPAIKVVTNNHYRIDKSWVLRHSVGKPIGHYLFQLSISDTSYTRAIVKGNTFDLYNFMQAYDGGYVDFEFTNNSITAEIFDETSPRTCLINATSVAPLNTPAGTYIVRDNTWRFKNLNNLARFYFYYPEITPEPKKWGQVEVVNNTVISDTYFSNASGTTREIYYLSSRQTYWKNNRTVNIGTSIILDIFDGVINYDKEFLSKDIDNSLRLVFGVSQNQFPFKKGSTIKLTGLIKYLNNNMSIPIKTTPELMDVSENSPRTFRVVVDKYGLGTDSSAYSVDYTLHLLVASGVYKAVFQEYYLDADTPKMRKKEVVLTTGMPDASYAISSIINGKIISGGILDVAGGGVSLKSNVASSTPALKVSYLAEFY